MSSKNEIRTILFDDQEAITAAIREHESFEIGGCRGRMEDMVEYVEGIIDSAGMTSHIYTKGMAEIASVFRARALPAGAADHNIAIHDLDYEVVKRPITKVLRLSYVKYETTIETLVVDASPIVGRNITDATSRAQKSVHDTTKDGANTMSKTSLKTMKSVGATTKNESQTITSAVSEYVKSIAKKANELTPDVVKSTAHRVSDSMDVISGVKLLETVQEMIELQEKYNDVLAGKLEEALLRIEVLEEALKSI